MDPIRCVVAAVLMLCAGGVPAQGRIAGQGTDASDLERAQRLAANPLKRIIEAGRAPRRADEGGRGTGIARLNAEPAPTLQIGPRLEALPSPAVLAAVLPLEALRLLPWPAAGLGGEGSRPLATETPNAPVDPLAPPAWRQEPPRSSPTTVRVAEAER